MAGTFGWPLGLSKKPWQSEGFYLILTAATIVGVVIALLHFDPIQLIFWSNVLGGTLAPVLIIFLLFVGNNRKIMRDKTLNPLTNIILVLTCIIMFAAVALLFYEMVTRRG
ncbi:MAG: divalent metal cation transporter [Ktedonobacteraceae bacterium]|nr:divalent metal cation transporter [Ktedonobacteraceae bacterium]